jgi:hypothetical protein
LWRCAVLAIGPVTVTSLGAAAASLPQQDWSPLPLANSDHRASGQWRWIDKYIDVLTTIEF